MPIGEAFSTVEGAIVWVQQALIGLEKDCLGDVNDFDFAMFNLWHEIVNRVWRRQEHQG